MRRLAVLVARGVEPALLFAAVAEEVALLLDSDVAAVVRFEPNGGVTLMGASGAKVTVTAGPLVRLELLKVGDTVNAKYYRSVAFVVKPSA